MNSKDKARNRVCLLGFVTTAESSRTQSRSSNMENTIEPNNSVGKCSKTIHAVVVMIFQEVVSYPGKIRMFFRMFEQFCFQEY